jgi:hypothetical protein
MKPMSDAAKATLRATARRTRVRTVRAALLAVVVLAGVAYAAVGAVPAEGALLGGIAGALGFWTMSLRLEQIALVRPERLPLVATVWTFYRMIVYGAFLFVAYRLDRENAYGLIGAVAGLMSTRFAITLVGIRQARAAQQAAAGPKS